MAKRKAPKRETARVDPPVTTLDPSGNLLKLVNPDGTYLKDGMFSDRFQFCWIRKNSDFQMAQYNALGYRMCRYAKDEVRPMFTMYTEHEDPDSNRNAIIERSDVCLMKRPIEFYDAEVARNRERELVRNIAMGKVERGDQRFARQNHSVIKPIKADEPDFTFGG